MRVSTLWQTTLQEDNPIWRILHTDTTDPERIKAAWMVQDVLAQAVDIPENNTLVLAAHESVQGEHARGLDCWCSPGLFVFGASPDFEEA